MTTLYLIRHGQASFGAADYDRLSDVGHRQARLLGDYFGARGVRPARAMTGSLRRHRETWEGIAAGFAAAGIATPPPAIRPGLDEYDAEQLLAARLAAHGEPACPADPASSGQSGSSAPSASSASSPSSPASPASAIVGHVGVAGDPADPEVRRAHFRLLRSTLTDWTEGRFIAPGHRDWPSVRQGAVDALLEAWRGDPATATSDDDIIVVSSGGPIAAILVGLLGMPAAGFVALNLQARNTGCTEFSGNGRRPNLAAFNGIAHLDTVALRSLITHA